MPPPGDRRHPGEAEEGRALHAPSSVTQIRPLVKSDIAAPQACACMLQQDRMITPTLQTHAEHRSHTGFRLAADLRERLAALAHANQLTLSAELRIAVREHLRSSHDLEQDKR